MPFVASPASSGRSRRRAGSASPGRAGSQRKPVGGSAGSGGGARSKKRSRGVRAAGSSTARSPAAATGGRRSGARSGASGDGRVRGGEGRNRPGGGRSRGRDVNAEAGSPRGGGGVKAGGAGRQRGRGDGGDRPRDPVGGGGGARADGLDVPRSWGGLARRGAGRLRDGAGVLGGRRPPARGRGRRSDDGRPGAAGPGAGGGGTRRGTGGAAITRGVAPAERDRPRAAGVARAERLRDAASAAVARAGRPVVQRDADDRPVSGAGSEVVSAREVLVVDLDAEGLPAQLERALGATAAARAEVRLREAAKAFGAERFEEAARLLRPVAQRAPGIPAVRELYGLTLYRLGRWRAAARELEAFRVLAGSTEQHPVLADCYRAMQRWRLVDELWAELRAASPSAELVTEGRIVAAGALADRGELPAAIRLLGQGFRFPRHPRVHHLRRAYALADLYERAGDIPQARDLFERVAGADPGFVDAAARARSLA